jgi:four helix bundle protein
MVRDYTNNPLVSRTYQFASCIIDVAQHLQQNKEYVLSKQLLRSGTAPGALVREAMQAQSNADFVHKLSIALKETDETDYWISLITEKGYFKLEDFPTLVPLLKEVFALLTSIIKKAKTEKENA